jgi:hypothetical protein
MEHDQQIFGNYSNLSINPLTGIVEIIEQPKTLSRVFDVINQKNAINHRDELIVANLKELGVTHLLDIGCDFGSLIHKAGASNIATLGLEVNPMAIRLLTRAGLPFCEESIQTFVQGSITDEKFNDFTFSANTLAISCLNILHGEWKDPNLRERLIDTIFATGDLFIITATSKQLRKILKRKEITLVGFLGTTQRPISRYWSDILQYGQTHHFKQKIFASIENRIYRLLVGKFLYSEKLMNYTRLVVILKKNRIL